MSVRVFRGGYDVQFYKLDWWENSYVSHIAYL